MPISKALAPAPSLLRQAAAASTSSSSICMQCRHLHRLNAIAPRVPSPSPFVPNTETFLKLIGRECSKYASNIPSWDALFTFSSEQLKEAGVEPARARRYLMWWRERYRNGIYGIGGDLKNVVDGVAELRIVQVPRRGEDMAKPRGGTLTQDAGMSKMVVNPPPMVKEVKQEGEEKGKVEKLTLLQRLAGPMHMSAREAERIKVAGCKIVRGSAIAATGVEPVKGHPGVVRLRVKEGLWEQRRGHKVDGGERRKAEVRFKRRAAERKNAQ